MGAEGDGIELDGVMPFHGNGKGAASPLTNYIGIAIAIAIFVALLVFG